MRGLRIARMSSIVGDFRSDPISQKEILELIASLNPKILGKSEEELLCILSKLSDAVENKQIAQRIVHGTEAVSVLLASISLRPRFVRLTENSVNCISSMIVDKDSANTVIESNCVPILFKAMEMHPYNEKLARNVYKLLTQLASLAKNVSSVFEDFKMEGLLESVCKLQEMETHRIILGFIENASRKINFSQDFLTLDGLENIYKVFEQYFDDAILVSKFMLICIHLSEYPYTIDRFLKTSIFEKLPTTLRMHSKNSEVSCNIFYFVKSIISKDRSYRDEVTRRLRENGISDAIVLVMDQHSLENDIIKNGSNILEHFSDREDLSKALNVVLRSRRPMRFIMNPVLEEEPIQQNDSENDKNLSQDEDENEDGKSDLIRNHGFEFMIQKALMAEKSDLEALADSSLASVTAEMRASNSIYGSQVSSLLSNENVSPILKPTKSTRATRMTSVLNSLSSTQMTLTQAKAMTKIYHMLLLSTNVATIVEQNGVNFLVYILKAEASALENNDNSSTVVFNACKALFQICVVDKSEVSTICNLDGFGILNTLLLKYNDVEAVTRSIFRLISIMLDSPANALKFLKANPIPDIVKVMITHSKQVPFSQSAVWLLKRMSSFEQTRARVLRINLFEIFFGIFRRHIEDPNITYLAISTLEDLIRSPLEYKLFQERKGLNTITKVLFEHKENANLILSTLNLVSHFQKVNPYCSKELKALDFVSIVSGCMDLHSSLVDIWIIGCQVLNSIEKLDIRSHSIDSFSLKINGFSSSDNISFSNSDQLLNSQLEDHFINEEYLVRYQISFSSEEALKFTSQLSHICRFSQQKLHLIQSHVVPKILEFLTEAQNLQRTDSLYEKILINCLNCLCSLSYVDSKYVSQFHHLEGFGVVCALIQKLNSSLVLSSAGNVILSFLQNTKHASDLSRIRIVEVLCNKYLSNKSDVILAISVASILKELSSYELVRAFWNVQLVLRTTAEMFFNHVNSEKVCSLILQTFSTVLLSVINSNELSKFKVVEASIQSIIKYPKNALVLRSAISLLRYLLSKEKDLKTKMTDLRIFPLISQIFSKEEFDPELCRNCSKLLSSLSNDGEQVISDSQALEILQVAVGKLNELPGWAEKGDGSAKENLSKNHPQVQSTVIAEPLKNDPESLKLRANAISRISTLVLVSSNAHYFVQMHGITTLLTSLRSSVEVSDLETSNRIAATSVIALGRLCKVHPENIALCWNELDFSLILSAFNKYASFSNVIVAIINTVVCLMNSQERIRFVNESGLTEKILESSERYGDLRPFAVGFISYFEAIVCIPELRTNVSETIGYQTFIKILNCHSEDVDVAVETLKFLNLIATDLSLYDALEDTGGYATILEILQQHPDDDKIVELCLNFFLQASKQDKRCETAIKDFQAVEFLFTVVEKHEGKGKVSKIGKEFLSSIVKSTNIPTLLNEISSLVEKQEVKKRLHTSLDHLMAIILSSDSFDIASQLERIIECVIDSLQLALIEAETQLSLDISLASQNLHDISIIKVSLIILKELSSNPSTVPLLIQHLDLIKLVHILKFTGNPRFHDHHSISCIINILRLLFENDKFLIDFVSSPSCFSLMINLFQNARLNDEILWDSITLFHAVYKKSHDAVSSLVLENNFHLLLAETFSSCLNHLDRVLFLADLTLSLISDINEQMLDSCRNSGFVRLCFVSLKMHGFHSSKASNVLNSLLLKLVDYKTCIFDLLEEENVSQWIDMTLEQTLRLKQRCESPSDDDSFINMINVLIFVEKTSDTRKLFYQRSFQVVDSLKYVLCTSSSILAAEKGLILFKKITSDESYSFLMNESIISVLEQVKDRCSEKSSLIQQIDQQIKALTFTGSESSLFNVLDETKLNEEMTRQLMRCKDPSLHFEILQEVKSFSNSILGAQKFIEFNGLKILVMVWSFSQNAGQSKELNICKAIFVNLCQYLRKSKLSMSLTDQIIELVRCSFIASSVNDSVVFSECTLEVLCNIIRSKKLRKRIIQDLNLADKVLDLWDEYSIDPKLSSLLLLIMHLLLREEVMRTKFNERVFGNAVTHSFNLEFIVSLLSKNIDYKGFALNHLRFLSSISVEENIRDQLLDSKVVETVYETLLVQFERKECVDVVYLCFEVLVIVSYNCRAAVDKLTQEGRLTSVKNIMERKLDDSNFMELACQLLANLTYDNQEVMRSLVERGFSSILIQIALTNLKDSATVVVCMQVITNLSFCSDNVQELISEGVIQAIVATISRDFASLDVIVDCAMTILLNISVSKCLDDAQLYVQYGLVQALVELIKSRLDNDPYTAKVWNTLIFLSRYESCIETMINQGILPILTIHLGLKVEDMEFVERGTLLLYSLGFSKKQNATKIVKTDNFFLVVDQLITRYIGEAKILQNVLRLLESLATSDSLMKILIDVGFLKRIMNIIRNSEVASIKTQALNILATFATFYPTSEILIRDNIPFFAEIFRKNSKNPAIIASLLKFLSSMCFHDRSGNVCKSLNVTPLLFAIIRSKSYPTQVCINGIQCLTNLCNASEKNQGLLKTNNIFYLMAQIEASHGDDSDVEASLNSLKLALSIEINSSLSQKRTEEMRSRLEDSPKVFVLDEKLREFLTNGSLVKIHAENKKSITVHLFVNQDFSKLCWKDPKKEGGLKSIRITSIKVINQGRCSPALRVTNFFGRHKCVEANSWAVICKNRFVASFENSNSSDAEKWVQALRLVFASIKQ